MLACTAWRHGRPAPRKAPGPPASLTDTVVWTRTLSPRERYRIVYRDRDGQLSERVLELVKLGHVAAAPGQDELHYLSVIDKGQPKTMRLDRVVSVIEQLTTGHEPSLRAQPTYASTLPPFPLPNAVYKVPQTAARAGSVRYWTVDLNAYTCTCPEKRLRYAAGYDPGKLGFVCDHMAKAILDHLPVPDPLASEVQTVAFAAFAKTWTPELLAFLRNPRKIHIDNLS